VSAPAQEVRKVSGPALHAVGHSTGFIVSDGDPGDIAFSFAIHTDDTSGGQPGRPPRQPELGIIELGGWEWCGPVDVEALDNPPPSPLAVLTVHLDDVGPAALGHLRDLIDQHLERYAECRVWPGRGASDALRRWIAGGCAADKPPSGEALAEAAQLVPRPADKPRVERSGMGWSISEPVADEVPARPSWTRSIARRPRSTMPAETSPRSMG
jgi:hypothetical protein